MGISISTMAPPTGPKLTVPRIVIRRPTILLPPQPLGLQGLVQKSVNRKKPGIGSWASFEDGLEEYKENELRKEWWYYVSNDNPYSTRNERRINKSMGTVIQPMKRDKPKQQKKPKNVAIPEE